MQGKEKREIQHKEDVAKINAFAETIRKLPTPKILSREAGDFLSPIACQLEALATACEEYRAEI